MPDVSSKNQNCDSDGHQAFVQQHKKQGAEQKLVGNGIEILTQDCALFEQAGQ